MATVNRKTGGSFSTGVGVLMALIQSLHPEWLGNHKWILPVCIAWVAVSAFLVLIQFKWVQRFLGIHQQVDTSAPSISQNNEAGRDVSSSPQVSNNYGAINYHLPARVDQAPLLPPDSSVTPAKVSPALVFHDISMSLSPDNNLGWDGAKSQPLVVLPIENRLSDEMGRAVGNSKCTCASLRFKRADGVSTYIPKAFWINERGNEVDIHAGEMKSLVLGKFEGLLWRTYQNDQQFAPNYSDFFYGSSSAGPEEHEILFLGEPITVEIKVFSRLTGETLTSRILKIGFHEESGRSGPSISEIK